MDWMGRMDAVSSVNELNGMDELKDGWMERTDKWMDK
jgi:hypothetical protein